ncbi:MAG: hypothetical protein AAGA71_15430 [Pseudomonadota bacterium]
MVGPSKILTVSYGTFSCTLEGFDDPFSTMKSIAEYFRDLAADDRYFGAEPPTPDAEMLHRIAEQEVQRRVEARVADDGIVLRQLEEDAPAPVANTPAAPVAEVAPAAVAQADPVEIDETDDGSIAAKLSRIRAVVARSRTDDDADDGFDAPLTTADPFSAPIESAFDDVDAADEIGPIADIDPLPSNVEEAAPQAPASEDVAPDSTGDPSEFEDADITPAPQPVFADASDITNRIIQLKRSDTAKVDPIVATDPVDESEDEEFFAAAFEDAPEEAPAEIVGEADAEALSDEDMPQDEDGVAEEETVDEIALTDDLDDPIDLEDLKALDGASDEDVVAEDAPEEALDSDVEDEPEFEEAAPEAVAEDQEPDDAPDADESVLAAVTAAVTAEDEVEPAAEEVSDTADEVFAAAESDDLDAEAAPAAEGDDADGDIGFEDEPSAEAAFDRILEETNSKLDETESSRRRSAIAHLKAAVAATKADRLLNLGVEKSAAAEEEQSQYRADLAKVVRPRRPDDTKASDARPSPMGEAPSPLMLVSEQRVDGAAEAVDRKSILPRRVNTKTIVQQEDPMADGANSFAEFAQQMGATELPDLLEAAAAYSAFVEGRREFSRPQLMRRVASYEQETFTREAGLRSFGQLLRQGKIQKLKRGQFTITDETRFNPEARVAGE